MMMIRHGLVSSALFVLCGVLYNIRGTRCLFLIKGMMTIAPVLCILWFFCLAANMGAPPSINLLSEVMTRIGILGKCWMLGGFVAVTLFFNAAYCLHLFVATQLGRLRKRFLGRGAVFPRILVCIGLHLIPVVGFILKREVVCSWC